MVALHCQILGAELLPARGDYPASALIKLYDEDAGETLNLVASTDLYETLSEMPKLSSLALKLRWRAVNLASLGGSGRGKAYRLSIVSVLSADESEVGRAR